MLSHGFEADFATLLGPETSAWLSSTGCRSVIDVAFMWRDSADLFKDYAVVRPHDFAGASQLVATSS